MGEIFSLLSTRDGLQEALKHTFVDSKRAEIKAKLADLDEQIAAWKREREERQGRLFT